MNRLAAFSLAVALVGALALPAVASGLSFPFTADLTPGRDFAPGAYLIATQDAGGSAGLVCTAEVTTANNGSEHDTNMLIKSGDTEVRIDDIEHEASVTKAATGTLTLGPTVEVWLEIVGGAGGGSSLAGHVTLICKTTTTTEETTSSTTTTSQASTTTSSTTPTPSTTTTQPNPTSTSSVPMESTSSTAPPAPTTTAPTGSSTTPPELPVTGVDTAVIALSAVALLVFGGLAVAATQEEN